MHSEAMSRKERKHYNKHLILSIYLSVVVIPSEYVIW